MIHRFREWIRSLRPSNDDKALDLAHFENRRESQGRVAIRFQKSLDDLNIAVSLLAKYGEQGGKK